MEPLVYMITAVSSEVGPLWTIGSKNIQTIYTITITIIIIKKGAHEPKAQTAGA